MYVETNSIKLRIEPGLAGLTSEQIQTAQSEAAKQGVALQQAIYNLGFIDERNLLPAMAQKFGIEYLDLSNCIIEDSYDKNLLQFHKNITLSICDHEVWEIFKNPAIYQSLIDDSQ